MDGKILARARDRQEQIRQDNARALEAHRRVAYEKAPQLREIERDLRLLVTKAAVTALQQGQDTGAAIEQLAGLSLALQARRREQLRTVGLPEDYIDEIYSCSVCNDSGYVNGSMCACLEALYKDEARKSLSNLLKLGNERFETFDLSYYSQSVDSAAGVSPRERMRTNLEYCRTYAEKFAPGADSLLLQGNTGLGKTFLSACIARVVAEKGYSVVYETAVACLADFETQKFSRGGEEQEQAAERVRRYLGCDLMILDDLGTELAGGYNNTALYTLINSRLCEGKATIISTNLTAEDLRRRYTPQIASRLEGDFQELPFLGSDVRKIKKNRALGL